jgi:threonine dehydrogenase-like Zn-dependent dehydrogenase
VKYGYSSVGQVLVAPEGARSALVGRTVFCLHPHQDLYTVPATAVTALPADLPPGRAVLAANMETAVNAFWDATPTAGDRIVVIGAGVVGLLTAWLCRQVPGARVTVLDVDAAKASAASALGLEFQEWTLAESDADVVVHASGSPEGLATALSVAGLEARIIELSWFGSREVPLPLGEAFHSRRLTIQSSQVGRIPASRAARWTHARRMALALELLRDPTLDHLISGESPFEELPDVMARLARDGRGVLCHRIRYPRS